MSDWIFHVINAFGDLGNGRSTSRVHSLRDQLLDVVTRIHMIADGYLRLCRAYFIEMAAARGIVEFPPYSIDVGDG